MGARVRSRTRAGETTLNTGHACFGLAFSFSARARPSPDPLFRRSRCRGRVYLLSACTKVIVRRILFRMGTAMAAGGRRLAGCRSAFPYGEFGAEFERVTSGTVGMTAVTIQITNRAGSRVLAGTPVASAAPATRSARRSEERYARDYGNYASRHVVILFRVTRRSPDRLAGDRSVFGRNRTRGNIEVIKSRK